MEVVAAQHRLLAFWTDEHAEVGLVGPLVGRETGVAVETVGAVFQRQALTVVVKFLYAGDDLLGQGVEIGLRRLVLLLMLLEPQAVVVMKDVVEESEDFFHREIFLAKVGKKQTRKKFSCGS